MDEILENFFKDELVLWKKKQVDIEPNPFIEYICTSDNWEILEKCFDHIMNQEKVKRITLVKDIRKKHNMNTYYEVLVRALKSYKISEEILKENDEIKEMFEDKEDTKSKLYIRI